MSVRSETCASEEDQTVLTQVYPVLIRKKKTL